MEAFVGPQLRSVIHTQPANRKASPGCRMRRRGCSRILCPFAGTAILRSRGSLTSPVTRSPCTPCTRNLKLNLRVRLSRLVERSSVTVGPSLVHKRLEEPLVVLLHLWVPEHADGELLGRILERLERAVFGIRAFDEPRTDPADTLV